ncbi:MAG: hypothetical protein JO168_24385 [Solirubrobacterales bacterium]|nr:hypothetical protein [Solirubrobacterales bacterium]
MERLGYQIDGAERDQVLIMPFLTEARTDGGILPANWQQIIPDILTGVRNALVGDDGTTVPVQALVVSSFSAAIIYSDSFRRHAPGVSSVLRRGVGPRRQPVNVPNAFAESRGNGWLPSDPVRPDPVKRSGQLPCAPARWVDYVAKPTSVGEVHGLIRDFMFTHASTITGVGGALAPPTTGTATHTITHTATFSGQDRHSIGYSHRDRCSHRDAFEHSQRDTLALTLGRTQSDGNCGKIITATLDIHRSSNATAPTLSSYALAIDSKASALTRGRGHSRAS